MARILKSNLDIAALRTVVNGAKFAAVADNAVGGRHVVHTGNVKAEAFRDTVHYANVRVYRYADHPHSPGWANVRVSGPRPTCDAPLATA